MSAFIYKVYYWILFAFFHVFYRFRVYGKDNVRPDACVICANHSSLADPLLVAVGMKNKNGYNQPKFLAKSELGSVPVLRALVGVFLVYVRRGESDIAAVKQSIAHLKSGGRLIVFPEGTRMRGGKTGDAKTGVIMMSMRSGAPLQPVYVTEGTKPPIFCRRVRVVFGERYMPVKREGESTTEAYHREADELMRRIRELGESVG